MCSLSHFSATMRFSGNNNKLILFSTHTHQTNRVHDVILYVPRCAVHVVVVIIQFHTKVYSTYVLVHGDILKPIKGHMYYMLYGTCQRSYYNGNKRFHDVPCCDEKKCEKSSEAQKKSIAENMEHYQYHM